jgi:dimethylglycine dehydrogenase
VALIERAELTSGSTWHAAVGFHALNDDPNIAALPFSLALVLVGAGGWWLGVQRPCTTSVVVPASPAISQPTP